MNELILATSAVLLISFICSLLEAATLSIPASHVEIMAENDTGAGKIFKRLVEDIERPISAILTLNTIANTGGAAVAGAAFAAAFTEGNEVYFTLGLSLAVLIFSEIIPKTAGAVYARGLAPYIARPLHILVWIFTPFLWLNRRVTRLITRNAPPQDQISAEEIVIIANMGLRAGSIKPEQEKVIRNILNLDNLRARDLMTPRTVVFSLSCDLTLAKAHQEAGGWAHSRIPLYNENKDDIVGLVLRREVFNCLAEGRDQIKLSELQRPIHQVPESARANQLLQDFLDVQRREHLFAVHDEYGVFSGLLTLEDVLEAIIGAEIVDESDLAVDLREQARSQQRRIISGSGQGQDDQPSKG